MLKVEESQKKGERLQVHYLSNESQNEFIAECSDLVKQHVFGERKSAKCYVIVEDSASDSSHVEQTTLLNLKNNLIVVQCYALSGGNST